jgi:uncharacterized integral membrane protein
MEHQHDPAQTPPVVSPPEAEHEAASEPAPEPAPPPVHHPPIEIGPRFYATLAAFLFFIAYSIAFIVGNDKHIPIDFVFATANVSVVWMILLLLAVGLVGGILLVELYRHRRSKKPREH